MGDDAKRAAGYAAAELVTEGMQLGLGTGSTVRYFLERLAARELPGIAGVPTSEDTAERCRELGIGLLEPGEVPRLALCVDGADELTADLMLTKGGGGALLREKVVAMSSARMVVIATDDKLVPRLADTFALPVEVVPFAVRPVAAWIEERGFHVERRGGDEYRTDNGNAILDARMPGGLEDASEIATWLSQMPGVAEHGLFIGLATEALLGQADGSVRHLTI